MPIYHRLGRAMAALCLAAFAAYVVCFIVILRVNPPFAWTDMADFAAYSSTAHNLCKYIAMAWMIVFACAYLTMVCCAGETAPPAHRLFARLAACFGTAFAVCISLAYFIQISATRLQMAAGLTEGLAQFTQSFPHSALNAVNMLGWTVFFALSALALSGCFTRGAGCRAVRFFCLFTAALMLSAAVGYVFDIYPLLLVTMYPGLGLAVCGLAAALFRYFKRAALNC